MAAPRPRAQWLYATARDWQPFPLSASAALEEALAAYGAGGAALAALDIEGAWEGLVDLAALRCRGAAPGAAPREAAVRREELFAAADVAALGAELRRLRAERDALAAELAALRPASARSSAQASSAPSGAAPLQPWASSAAGGAAAAWPGPPGPPAPGAGAASNASWRSATSQGSGLLALSQGSLEAIAEWVFALARGARPSSAYERTLVPPGDPRRQWLEDHFLSSLRPHRRSYNSEEWCPAPSLQVMKIWEVVNESANLAYRRELEQLRAARPGDRAGAAELGAAIPVRTEAGGPRLNEVLLFHGCKWETVFAILREGFDSRLGGTNAGAAFGIGSYFSTVASKADQYTQRWGDWERRPPCQVPPELHCMLVGRVALGEIHEMRVGDQTLRRPPLGPDGVRRDSVLGVPRARGGCVDYDEFVIYKSGQATPQFVIEYEHSPECRCRSCVNPWP